MITSKASEQDSLLNSLIEQARKCTTTSQEFDLYSKILLFLSEHRDQAHLIRILNSIDTPHIFDALLSQLLTQTQETPTVAVHSFLLHYIELPSAKFRIKVIVALLRERGDRLERVVSSCKASQAKCETLLALTNETLLAEMRKAAVVDMNFTHTALLAFKCVEHSQQCSPQVVQEALRHLLIVNCIQRGQVAKLLLENEGMVGHLELLGKRQSVSGFWYYLLAKVEEEARRQGAASQKWKRLVEQAFARALAAVEPGKGLHDQIDKIMYSSASEREKANLLCQLRGFTHFLSSQVQGRIQLGSRDSSYVPLIEGLMQIKDFACFQSAIRAYLAAIDHGLAPRHITAAVARSVEENCLPMQYSSKYGHSQYNSSQLNFYSCALQERGTITVSVEGSLSMDRILQMVMQSRECTEKHGICECCEEYIHSSIERQYDHEFNSHQFSSACHLMCREVARVAKLGLTPPESESLKEYLTTNLKWLLNLNESCPPQYRRCINYKVFDLVTSFPPLFRHNPFLQQVVQDLLLSRLPHALPHLHRFLASLLPLAPEPTEFSLDKLSSKLLKKLAEDNFALEERMQLWQLVLGVWERDERRVGELQELPTLNDDDLLAQHAALKGRKGKVVEKGEGRVAAIRQKMESARGFYLGELACLQRHCK